MEAQEVLLAIILVVVQAIQLPIQLETVHQQIPILQQIMMLVVIQLKL